jgi:hypothetical protein
VQDRKQVRLLNNEKNFVYSFAAVLAVAHGPNPSHGNAGSDRPKKPPNPFSSFFAKFATVNFFFTVIHQ